MRRYEPLLLHVVLKIDHEQGATLSHNIIMVTHVLKRIIESCGSQSVHDVDNDLQCVGEVVRFRLVLQIRSEFSAKHLRRITELLMLDGQAGIEDVLEVLGVLAKEVELHNRRGMHRSNVNNSAISPNARLSMNVTTLRRILVTI